METDTIDGIQNPLFGIVSFKFLTGFEFEEMKDMVRVLGRKMGLQFNLESMKYLFNRYGGHPLLTRATCSAVNQTIQQKKMTRPYLISKNFLESGAGERDADLQYYCRHVVSELRDFYPSEYDLLELLSCGHIADFLELAVHDEHIKHLKSYGLLGYDNDDIPFITIPVVGRYIALELATQEGRKTILKLIEKEERELWIERRLNAIVRDFRWLEKVTKDKKAHKIFGANSFPEADRFIKLEICNNLKDFENFINICNRCFVESVENYGEMIGMPRYFWAEFAASFPSLSDSLKRIKAYRIDVMHIELNPRVSESLKEYLDRDLEGRNPGNVPELYFTLQQCVLEGLFNSIHIEICRYE